MKPKEMFFSVITAAAVLLSAALVPVTLSAQSGAVTRKGSLNIVKEVKPPILKVVDFYLEDPSGNNAIDANEICHIVLKIKNEGYGSGMGMRGVITGEGSKNGLDFSSFNIPEVGVGETYTLKYPIKSDMHTVDGSVNFAVRVDEPMGFGTDNQYMTVDTRKFSAPLIRIVDYSVTGAEGGTLKKMQKFSLQVLVQNTQHGHGERVNIRMKLPEGVLMLDGNEYLSIPELKPGETRSIDYDLIVNNRYALQEIPIHFDITEKYGRFSENKDITLSIDQQFSSRKIDVASVHEERSSITVASLRSDVDRDIPVTGESDPDRFAIVIGNEDYHSYQRGLSSESDVAFAVNDARVFGEYCTKVMGVPKENLFMVINGRWSDMNREISRVKGLLENRGSRAELIFYYAGHGFPDEKGDETFLIPVDISGADYRSGIKVSELYDALSETGAGKITVFMDACFSGGGRNAGLLAARGIKVAPKAAALRGNLVVFAATSSDQVALPYKEKQHGMFTYFLLKKLQSTSGDCSYSELSEYLSFQVRDWSLRVNDKPQDPVTSYSPAVESLWSRWRIGGE